MSCWSVATCTAVGYQGSQPLVERWNGDRWLIQKNPRLATSPNDYIPHALSGASCPSKTMCTAVGQRPLGQQLAERWDGSRWSLQQTPMLRSSTLSGVSCPSETVCVAVGAFATAPVGPCRWPDP